MEEFDIHHHKRTLEVMVRRLEKSKSVRPEDQKLILDFYRDSVSRGLSKSRHIKYLIVLPQLSEMLGIGFKKATKDDIKKVVVKVEQKEISDWYKKDFKIILKFFYKWMNGGEDYPPEVKWIKANFRNEKHKLPEDLITEDEVRRMATATNHPRDNAFIQILYESGCRIAELLTLRMKGVSFDKYGAILRVHGKTGDRRVRLLASAPALAAWLNMHPKHDSPDSPVWVSRASKKVLLPFNYSTANVLLRKLAKKAGINKRVNPHIFRHSRATALASKLTEAQMKEYFGWTQSSEMASIYVHMSGRDVDSTLLALNGLEKPEEKREEFQATACPRCKESNSPNAKFCLRCGSPIQVQLMAQIEEERKTGDNVLNKLMENVEFKEFLFKKMGELGLDKQL